MYHSVAQILKGILTATSSDIPFFISVAFEVTVDAGEHGIGADIEFALVDQQGIVDVLLNDTCSFCIGG
jgi:hypothetical protein